MSAAQSMPALELEEQSGAGEEGDKGVAVEGEKVRAEEKSDHAAQAAKATIGIIYPPPEVRSILCCDGTKNDLDWMLPGVVSKVNV